MDYVLSIKGTPSGEHGDGLSGRRTWRRCTATEIYGVFKEIKTAFDPRGIMNPGQEDRPQPKAWRPAPSAALRADYWTYDQTHCCTSPTASTRARSRSATGARSARASSAPPCAPFKSTRREHASPRAKANLLRNMIQGKLRPRDLYAGCACKTVTDYCIECGMCAVECPSNVNIPKLMLEAKSKYREARRATPVDMVLSRAELVSKLGHLMPPRRQPSGQPALPPRSG